MLKKVDKVQPAALPRKGNIASRNTKYHPKILAIPNTTTTTSPTTTNTSTKKMIFAHGNGPGDKRSTVPTTVAAHNRNSSPSPRRGRGQQKPQQSQKICPVSANSTSSSSTSSSSYSSSGAIYSTQLASICREVALVRDEHMAIRNTLSEKEGELGKTRVALRNLGEERDQLRNKVSELENIVKHSSQKCSHAGGLATNQNHSTIMSTMATLSSYPMPPLGNLGYINNNNINSSSNNNNKLLSMGRHSSLSSPPSSSSFQELERNGNRHDNENGNDVVPQTTMNGGSSGNCHKNEARQMGNVSRHQHHHLSQSGISGLDLMLLGPDCSTKVVEHLVHPWTIQSSVREIEHRMVVQGCPMSGEGVREVEIEVDWLNSRIDHLRSQNNGLTLNLEDAKGHADRLTELLGKYDSNNVALQLALRYSDQMTGAYEVLVALLETEMGQVLANLHARGQLNAICSSPSPNNNNISGGSTIPTTSTSVSRSSGNNNNSNDNSPSEQVPPVAVTGETIKGINGSALNSKSGNNVVVGGCVNNECQDNSKHIGCAGTGRNSCGLLPSNAQDQYVIDDGGDDAGNSVPRLINVNLLGLGLSE